MARAAGLLLVDAAQSAGAADRRPRTRRPPGVHRAQALLGPRGPAASGPRRGQAEPRFRGGPAATRSWRSSRTWPDRARGGTQNAVGLAGLLAGVAFIAETGLAKIRAHEVALARRLLDGLRDIERITVTARSAPRARADTSVTFAGIVPSEAGFLLEEGFGVLTRVGLHCAPAAHRTLGTYPQGTVRFAPGCFSTKEDIDVALEGCRYLAAKKHGAR
jgi:selenocysteine lyase/cysteine desulfurase